jgi:peptidoglycan/LPS O-acetylase OafA/YrhL
MTDSAQQFGSTREHGLDLLRAAAILMVVSFHAGDLSGTPAALYRVLAFGWMGVDLFFVLSGFLIGRQVLKPRVDSPGRFLESFWTKRWLRTLPLYYVVLFFHAVVKPAVFHVPFKGSVWRFATFTQNYAAPLDFVASWSLCVEEQFYLFLPLVVVAMGRRRLPRWGWLVPLAASAVMRAFLWRTLSASGPIGDRFQTQIHWPTHTHLDGLSLGLVLAATERIWSAWPARRKRGIATCGLLLWVATCVALGPSGRRTVWTAVLLFPLVSAAFALMLVGVRGLVLPRLFHRVIESIALLSYGAYLWFGLVSRLVNRSSERLGGNWPLEVACFVAGTFAFACVTYHVVERPALVLRDRLLAARVRVERTAAIS